MSIITLSRQSQKANKDVSCYVKGKRSVFGFGPDIFTFLVLLIAANMHLLTDNYGLSMIFLPSAFMSGEWWRLFTHPFVHLSWYHLILDAGAFLLLYGGLEEKRIPRRILYVIICGSSSLAAALLVSPQIYTLGLCGLSGIAHGLMAVSSLEMMKQKENFLIGIISFLLVVSKSIYETVTGDVIFSFMHMGLCGIPLAACHAGGVLGGILVFSLCDNRRDRC